MTIQDLISKTVPFLKPEDSVEHALSLLREFRVQHLPVVDEQGKLVGIASEDRLLDALAPEADLHLILGPAPISARPDHHVFELTKLMMQHALSTLPVAEEDGTYVGVVRRNTVFEQFARMLSTQKTGAILALEVDPRDYSLSKLAHAIEQSNSDLKILSIATEMPKSSEEPIRVTLKLNVADSARVRHMLEHHGYHVVAAFGEYERDSDLQRRVEEFTRYLEV